MRSRKFGGYVCKEIGGARMTLMRFILDALKDADLRRRARARPEAAAKRYGLSPETVGFYLKMMGEG